MHTHGQSLKQLTKEILLKSHIWFLKIYINFLYAPQKCFIF